MNTTELVVEMRHEKIQARTGFEPMTMIPVQRSTNWANNWVLVIIMDPHEPFKWWIMTGNIWKSYVCNAVKKWDITDPRSYEHYWTSTWNETLKGRTGLNFFQVSLQLLVQ